MMPRRVQEEEELLLKIEKGKKIKIRVIIRIVLLHMDKLRSLLSQELFD